MKNDTCIFCKIVAGDIPAIKVYEDDEVLAFLDAHPINPGHSLVIPKEHHAKLSETPIELAASMMKAVPHLGTAIMKAVGAPAFNLGCNNGVEAGQAVDHVHLHVMPRFADDGYEVWHGRKELEEDAGQEVANKIRAEL
jgi:histidine triad (HIT) family protein